MNIQDIKIDLSHSVQEIEIILAGLKKLPMEVAMELYAKIHGAANAKVAEQLTPKVEEPSNDSA
jgi:hypothetical protein